MAGTSIILPNNSGDGGGGALKGYASTLLTTPASLSLPSDVQTAITGLNVSYTPTSASSKIIITVEFMGAITMDGAGNQGVVLFGLFKNGSPLGNIPARNLGGDEVPEQKWFAFGSNATLYGGMTGGGAKYVKAIYSYEETAGNTTARTYAATALGVDNVLYINREDGDFERYYSRISVMEI